MALAVTAMWAISASVSADASGASAAGAAAAGSAGGSSFLGSQAARARQARRVAHQNGPMRGVEMTDVMAWLLECGMWRAWTPNARSEGHRPRPGRVFLVGRRQSDFR